MELLKPQDQILSIGLESL